MTTDHPILAAQRHVAVEMHAVPHTENDGLFVQWGALCAYRQMLDIVTVSTTLDDARERMDDYARRYAAQVLE